VIAKSELGNWRFLMLAGVPNHRFSIFCPGNLEVQQHQASTDFGALHPDSVLLCRRLKQLAPAMSILYATSRSFPASSSTFAVGNQT
jgi:hypothetical protein